MTENEKKNPTITQVRAKARADAAALSRAVAGAINRLDLHISRDLASMRDDLDAMAAALGGYMDRDRLMRKIIVRTIPLRPVNAPPDVIKLLIAVGLIAKPKREQAKARAEIENEEDTDDDE